LFSAHIFVKSGSIYVTGQSNTKTIIHRPILHNVNLIRFVIFMCNYRSGHLAVYLLVWFVAVPVLSVDSKLVQW